MLEKKQKLYRRHRRIRAKIYGNSEVPRLCVSRSNKHICAQLIDDQNQKIILAVADKEFKNKKKENSSKKKLSSIKVAEGKEKKRTGKVAIAFEVGKLLAKMAQEKKIEKVVFDRGGYQYHGRIKALAEGARDGGLKF